MDIDLNCSSFSFSGISMGVKVFSTKVYKRKRFKGPFYLHYEWKSLGDENEEPVDNFSYFSGGGGVLPIVAYTERFRPKGVPSSFKNGI